MRRERVRKFLKISLIVLGVLILVGILTFQIMKGWLLDKAVAKIKDKLKSSYGLVLTIDEYELDGWSEVEMKGIKCLTAEGDTLAVFAETDVKVKVWSAIRGQARLEHIRATKGLVDIGLATELKSLKTEEIPEQETKDSLLFHKMQRYLHLGQRVAKLLPDNCEITELKLLYSDSTDSLQGHIHTLQYEDKQLLCNARLTVKGKTQDWSAKGTFDKRSLETDVHIETSDTTFYNFNFIRKLAKADVGFRSFDFILKEIEDEEDRLRLKGGLAGDGVFLYNENLSRDTLYVRHGAFSYDVEMDEKRIRIDSSSKVTLNDLRAGMMAEYRYDSPQVIKMGIDMPWVNATSFIRSLPKGAFSEVEGMQLDGQFSYKLDFYLALTTKDSVLLNSDLEGQELKIKEYGRGKLDKLNTSFTYTPYNSNRKIVVGPENPTFTRLDTISDYLKDAILMAEDPSFFYHKGFVQEALEQSILENLEEGEFKRGGSTISMQLVKNVFLTHKKTIDRKLEEALIVWLIENLRISSKARMYEVYLNIIEWGPGIYGVGEATEFYFNKKPWELNLSEALFLAYIVRRPLKFMYNYDEYGSLRDYVKQRLRFIANRMYRRGHITEDEYGSLWISAPVSGRAREYMRIVPREDSTFTDTLIIDDW